MQLSSSKLDVTKAGNKRRGTGSREREREAETGRGEQETGNATGNGERGTGDGERGAGSGERPHPNFALCFCKKIDATINSSEHKQ